MDSKECNACTMMRLIQKYGKERLKLRSTGTLIEVLLTGQSHPLTYFSELVFMCTC